MNVKATPSARRRGASARKNGFTLLEALLASVIVGLGVVGIVMSAGSSTRLNGSSRQLTQAAFLGQQVREWTLQLPFSDLDEADKDNPPGPDGADPQTLVDDLDDLINWDGAGITYSPPRDGSGSAMSDLTGWSQTIVLTWRDEDNLQSTVSPGTSDVIHVAVTVSHQGIQILNSGWLVIRRD